MSINNVEIQDSVGNVYYPHTDASVVKFGDSDVGTSLSEKANNWIKGEKINFIGDSITWGYDTETQLQMENPYPKLIGELLNCITNNYGMNNNCISGTGGMCERVLTMDTNADINVIMGGTNDWSVGITIGKITDTDITTLYGALNTLCTNIINTFPNAINYFILPTKPLNNDFTMERIVNTIIDVSKKYGFLVIDMYNDAPNLNPNITTLKNRWITDGVHPSATYIENYFAPTLAKRLLTLNSDIKPTGATNLGEYGVNGNITVSVAGGWVGLTNLVENMSSKSVSFSDNTLTILEDGLYEILFSINTASNYAGTFSNAILKNASFIAVNTERIETAIASFSNIINCERTSKLGKGDVISFVISSSVNCILECTNYATYVQIKKL